MHYVYIIKSQLIPDKFYVGYTLKDCRSIIVWPLLVLLLHALRTVKPFCLQ